MLILDLVVAAGVSVWLARRKKIRPSSCNVPAVRCQDISTTHQEAANTGSTLGLLEKQSYFCAMSEIMITRFKKEFSVNGQVVAVRFEPVNIAKKQLYHVYIPYQGKELRCHMQLGEKGFYMTDPARLPAEYHSLEQELAAAIMEA